MSMVDPEEERRRLTERYAGMSEGELKQVAGDGDELSEVAEELLLAEMAKRGLEAPAIDLSQGKPDEVELQELVTIRKFRDLPEAMLAKGSLESAGMECYLVDDNMVRIDWFISNLLGGVKLKVRADDAAEATALLDEPIPEGFDVEGVGAYEQPRCPKCNSLEVTFTGLNKPIAYTSAWLNFPMPIESKVWRCDACGAKWVNEPEAVAVRPNDLQ